MVELVVVNMWDWFAGLLGVEEGQACLNLSQSLRDRWTSYPFPTWQIEVENILCRHLSSLAQEFHGLECYSHRIRQ